MMGNMMGKRFVMIAVVCTSTSVAWGQKSSLGARARDASRNDPPPFPSREAPAAPRNAVYERHSWITMPPPAPRTYKPGDLLTIIIRETRRWEADADLNTRKEWDVTSELAAFMKWIDGGLGSSSFTRGNPNIEYAWENEMRSDGDSSREDRLTTRLTAKIIDVKPNGTLVLEGRARVIHDDEFSEITVTGVCRKEDVSPDNTILSTQLASKEVMITNEGALRAASSRGWIPKLVDVLKPF